jgi:CRP-like cAMP-binding protein
MTTSFTEINTMFKNKKIEKTLISLNKNEALFIEGEANQKIYLLKKGKIFISKHGTLYSIAFENELIGLTSCMCDTDVYFYTATTEDKAELIAYNKTDFKNLVEKNADLGRKLITILCSRINYTEHKINSYSSFSPLKKIIEQILSKSEEYNNTNYCPYTITDIQKLTMIPIQELSKIIDFLIKNDAIISHENKIEIKNRTFLKRFIE